MSEMIERVAKAIADCNGHDWEHYCDEASAAIAAMREPTDTMHLAAKEKREADKRKGQPTPWGDIYRAMIGAALAEKEGTE